MNPDDATPAQTNPPSHSSANLIPPSLHDSLPSVVKNEIVRLPPQTQEAFIEEYRRKEKSTAVGYLLWFLGFHYAYFGKWGLLAIYWLTIGGLWVWMIVDLFRIPGITRSFNKDLAVDVLRNIKSVQ